ncbi:MAG TPA: T9SS type A sorting domain-containing protein [Bacteroidales bacterium]|nr:T9SS type A sorting domain-containing protein [Bacteroidales bacterium]
MNYFVVILITIMFTIRFSGNAYCQQWQTAEHMGGYTNDACSSIITDSEGNVYVGGIFSGTGHFQNQTIVSNGLQDFFLAKYNSAGSLVWVKRGGGGGNTPETAGDEIYKMAIDDQNRLFVAGTVNGTAMFGNIAFSCYGQLDAFLAHYDTAGSCIWVRHMGGQYRTGANSIVLDDNSHIYITGVTSFTNSLHCMDTSISMDNQGFFLAKFDINGNFDWIRSISGEGSMSINDIGRFGNELVLVGNFSGEIICDTMIFTTQKTFQPVLFKMDTNGKFIWGKTFDCTTLATVSALALSNSGSLYCTGWSIGTFSIGNDTLADGGTFILKLWPDGSPAWMRKAGSNIQDVVIAEDEVVYVSGVLGGSHYISDCLAIGSPGVMNLYIAKLDTNGNCQGVTMVPNVHHTYETVFDAQNLFYITGYCEATEFGSISVGNYGEMDAFWAKLDYVSGMQEQGGGVEHALFIYANPNTGVFHVKVPRAVSNERDLVLRIFDNSNRLVHEQPLDMGGDTPRIHVSHARPGMYHLQLITKYNVYTGKMIVE